MILTIIIAVVVALFVFRNFEPVKSINKFLYTVTLGWIVGFKKKNPITFLNAAIAGNKLKIEEAGYAAA